jgi:uncharacterized protein (TIGR02145 family)
MVQFKFSLLSLAIVLTATFIISCFFPNGDDVDVDKSKKCNIEYGTFTDSRDSKEYKTVVICSQTWLAKNLNYNASSSRCYGNLDSNCDTYGRLYDWNTAITACPSGWHLPSRAEWTVLTDSISKPGLKLKATDGWKNGGNGTNDYGFSALPGGNCYNNCSNIDSRGYWWSSTDNSTGAWYMYIDGSSDYANEMSGIISQLYSVRCVKDQ